MIINHLGVIIEKKIPMRITWMHGLENYEATHVRIRIQRMYDGSYDLLQTSNLLTQLQMYMYMFSSLGNVFNN